MTRIAILLPLLVIVAAASGEAQSQPYTLVDVVVFGAYLPVDMSSYPPEVRSLLQQHIKRSQAYRPRPRPPQDPDFREMNMVYGAREDYERRMFAIAGPGVERLAQQYVDELRPCYEWEGLHDCPEEEAKFAEQYLAKNPKSPFRELLPLLAANRWLCAAAGYELEERPQDAARSRRASEAPLAVALKSASLLIRTAAQELKARGRCNPER
jgi:hypothetical protein